MAGLPKQNGFMMMLEGKAVCGLCTIAFFIYAAAVGAYAGAGTVGADFLKVNVGGRASAFCGAYTAVSGDVVSAQYNPAGIAKMEKREISFMHNEWAVDTRYEFLAIGLPLKNGGLSLSARYFDLGSFTGRNTMGQKTDDFKANDESINLSYGQELNEVLSMGISLIYIKQTIASRTSSGLAADFGVNADIVDGFLSLGASAKNIGPKMSAFENEDMDLPQSYNVGFAMTPKESNVMVTGDLSAPKNETAFVAFGIEYDVFNLIDVRAGANVGSAKENDIAWSMGMGLKIWEYSLDYCFEPLGDLDSGHRISMSIKF